MVRIGDWNRESTLVKKWGRPRIAWLLRCVDSGHRVKGGRGYLPPSRLNPNIIRELDVTENKPQCQIQIMTRTIKRIAPVLPKMSIRIWTTGWPTSLSTVVAKSWMEKRRAIRRKKPKTAETPMDINTPSGALHAAFFVSSDKWAEAS